MPMSHADRRQFLAQLHVGVLAVVDGDQTLSVPIWYSYDPDVGVSVITGGRSRKAQAVRRAGRYSLTVQTESVPYVYVSAEGPLVEDRPAEAEGDLRPMAVRYLGDEAGNHYTEAWRSFGAEDVVLVMRPERWLSHDTAREFEELGITSEGGAVRTIAAAASEAPTRAVSVLGLGAMGTALAGSFLEAGHTTTVWNRTPRRADPLLARGARGADTVAEAVAASSAAVLSLLDADAVLDVLGQIDDLAGRTVIDLTSTTPDDAEQIHAAVTARGGRSLIGAVMVTPPMVGTGDTLVLYSGDRTAFDEHRSLLGALGGDAAWVGDEPGSAALLDLGMLDLFYGSVTSFLHAAALAGADGMPAKEFLPYARAMLDLSAETAAELADDLDAGRFPGEENNLAMMLRGADHIVDASVAKGLDPAVPELTRRLMRAAVDRGHGSEGYGRIVDDIRRRQARS